MASNPTITGIDPDVLESHILSKIDGPSLACTASTCHLLHTLCNKDNLWKDMCNATWNSVKHPLVQETISKFPGGYRSFFCHAFPLVRPIPWRTRRVLPQDCAGKILSAVDIYYGRKGITSKVIVTDTGHNAFLDFSFWLNLLDSQETVKIPLKFEGDENKCMLKLKDNLGLSWILIDPIRKHAVNISSLTPISVRPHWNGNDVQVMYATILSGFGSSEFVECRIEATIRCKYGKDVKISEACLYLEDMHSMRLNGDRSLRIFLEAMENGERKKGNEQEEREIYMKYRELKRKRIEGDYRRETRLRIGCRVACLAYLIAFVFFCNFLNVF
ncbi:hypothetical protein DCAR_0313839 [Daucus carota subsp. sativus]|uniref:Uncharacterized protein n=1 Tax=Daucus carota subsp. sativus TaxID=79200 RepID=A0A166C953_DAUCS|nr:PREDICTED: F-box protein At2g27310-like [Daucus carota subsp. sativus]WOG94543.1 hypothetical protein DCAR_0313839 [Daucus carota subsp. sativus]